MHMAAMYMFVYRFIESLTCFKILGPGGHTVNPLYYKNETSIALYCLLLLYADLAHSGTTYVQDIYYWLQYFENMLIFHLSG